MALSNAPLLQNALNDAYGNSMVVVASGADEGSAHQMMPGNREHPLLVNGIDVNGRLSGFISATHGPDEMAATLEGFRGAIQMLRAEGELPRA